MPPELNTQETALQQNGKFDTSMVVGIGGIVVSLIGVALAIYFYIQTKEEPGLCYYINPIKTAIVKIGQSSKFTTYFDNKTITTDVTAAQVHIWNAGKKAIKQDLILKPIVLVSGKRKILEATILKKTREVVDFHDD